jgi:hypothetical protein
VARIGHATVADAMRGLGAAATGFVAAHKKILDLIFEDSKMNIVALHNSLSSLKIRSI